ncbi:hypothetical protein FPHOBKDP_00081 [Listeria phage LPJP1]|nr:hypothetical protein FPHOBKDP_00081 [Listeria phage LPJP1]
MSKDNNIQEIFEDNIGTADSDKGIRGKVIFRNADTKQVINIQDNLILQRTRVFVMEALLKEKHPSTYNEVYDPARSICLFSVGEGGADINASPFTPVAPKFNDNGLAQKFPFITVDPDKDNDTETQDNPSIVKELTDEQKMKYYLPQADPDGTVKYYGKRFNGATNSKPFGNSKGWNINTFTGEVSYSLSLTIDPSECRGGMINELCLWLGRYNETKNSYENISCGSRLTFDSISLSGLSTNIEMEYIIYVA